MNLVIIAAVVLLFHMSLATAPKEGEDVHPQLSCSLYEKDPNLHEMIYDVGDGEQTTLVYIDPDVSTFYQLESSDEKRKLVQPKENSLSAKFINMRNRPVSFYW